MGYSNGDFAAQRQQLVRNALVLKEAARRECVVIDRIEAFKAAHAGAPQVKRAPTTLHDLAVTNPALRVQLRKLQALL